jgi:hypothetical protein
MEKRNKLREGEDFPKGKSEAMNYVRCWQPFFKSDKFILIEYLLSKVCQFLVYIILIVGILAMSKYLINCQ